MSLRWIQILALVLLSSAPGAQAAVRPFVLAGGCATQAEKSDLDEMLDEYTIRQRGGSWEAGAGLRIIPGGTTPRREGSPAANPSLESPIEIRLRFSLGGGDLPGTQVSGLRTDYSYRNRFLVSSRESFSYETWALGAFFSAWVHDRIGFYLGPVLQTVKYDATRSWTGPTDCYLCGPAKDKATSRYGAVEAGAHYTLRQIPLRIEGFWVPARASLSTTHIVQSENYKAIFSSFKGSLGARVSWEF